MLESSESTKWLRLGLTEHQAGRWREAETHYRRILESEPHHAEALRLLGVLERQRGNLEAARACLEQSLAVQPDSAFAHHDLGLVWAELGRTDDAIAAYRRAIDIQPRFADAHHNLGNAFYTAQNRSAAETHYRRAVQLQPDLAEAHFNLGLLAQESGESAKAVTHYRDALERQPNHHNAQLNLGLALKESGRFKEAEDCLAHLLQSDPSHVAARVNLASLLAERSRRTGHLDPLKHAEFLCLEALERQPALPQACLNLGVIRQALGHIQAAIESFQNGLRIEPENPEVQYNLGIAQLLAGEFESGWKNYEARWRTANPLFASRGFREPLWTGQNLAKRTLLIHSEQGLGDTIQFSRFASMAAARGARVLLECPAPLTRLLRSVEGVSEVLVRGNPWPAHDFQVPLMSLPHRMGTTLATLPNRVPYLKVPTSIRIELPPIASGLRRVGIVWSGNPRHGNDRSRSIPLPVLAPLGALPGIVWHSFQVEPAGQPRRDIFRSERLVDLGPRLTDFAMTAAAIQQMDLVISVDTAVAHLAGALGKTVWVLLPFAPDWRWLLDRDDSPWYPTARLFRQSKHGDWPGVVARVAQALSSEP